MEGNSIAGPVWSVEYDVEIFPNTAMPGEYLLTNLVTLTPDGTTTTGVATATAAATITVITAPSTPTDISLSATVTQEAFEYTLTAVRTLVSDIESYGIWGMVHITNDGTSSTEGLYADIELYGDDGSGYVLIHGPESVDLSAKPVLGPKGKGQYPFSFDVSGGPWSSFKVVVYAGANNSTNVAEDSAEGDVGDPDPDTEIDKTADVDDELTNLDAFLLDGFSLSTESPYRWQKEITWLDIIDNSLWTKDTNEDIWTTTYSIRVTNDLADKGGSPYDLNNTATIYRHSAPPLEPKIFDTADAAIIITVPDQDVQEPSLSVTVESETNDTREKQYSWTIEKDVILIDNPDLDPPEDELESGESASFEYTLKAERTETVTGDVEISGQVTVTNDGDLDLFGVELEIELQYSDDGGTNWQLFGAFKESDVFDLDVGSDEVVEYSFSFDPGENTLFRIHARAETQVGEVTVADEDDSEETLSNEIPVGDDESADVKDEFTNYTYFTEHGLGVDRDSIEEWEDIIATGSGWTQGPDNVWTITYTIVVTNLEDPETPTGTYPLDNTVEIFGKDSETKFGEDHETITITVPPALTEELTVGKTVQTSFKRTHLWDIDKSVVSGKGHTIGEDNIPKIWLYADGSGDETATWYVDVTYEGSNDHDFRVSGTITITNTGEIDVVITRVVDLLGRGAIDIEWPVGTVFPHTLEGTYSEDVDSKIEGDNVVMVTTQRDSYSVTEPVVWGVTSKTRSTRP